MKSLIVLLFYCSIVLLLVARPVGAQGVNIGEWFKLGRDCIKWKYPHGPHGPKGKCLEWEEIGIKGLFPDFSSFGSFVSSVLPNIYTIAGIILLFLLIFGGFTYIVNAGKENPEGVNKGKQAITAALIGFLLIFGSWWIIQIIEIVTGIDILK